MSLTDPFGLCPDPNSNFKNFCKVLYYTDWNAVGHAALSVAGVFWDGADVANMFWYMAEGKMDKAAECAVFALPVMGSWAGSLFMKGSKTSKFGSTLKTVSQLTQGSVGIYCGVDMTVTGITNMLNSIDEGTINPEDVFMTIGGIAATAIWGKSVLPSGGVKRITNSIGDAYKTRKANRLSELGKQGRLIDADISHAPVGGSTTSTADRIRSVAQRSFDYAVNNPRRLGLNRMQLGKDAEVQATRWTRKWAQRNGIDLSENGLRFQVRGEHSIPDVVYESTKNVWDFKLTSKAVRKNQSKNFANDFVGYTVEYIFGPGPWRDG